MQYENAIAAMRYGKPVARKGWNGKGMFIYMVPAAAYPAQTGVAKAYFGALALVPYGAYTAMKTADGNVVPWLCSQSDQWADDWEVFEMPAPAMGQVDPQPQPEVQSQVVAPAEAEAMPALPSYLTGNGVG